MKTTILLRFAAFACLIFAAAATHTAKAQDSQAAHINIFLQGTEHAKVGDHVTLVIEVTPKAGWHAYSAIPSEEGVYKPAEVGWELDARGFEAEPALKEQGPRIEKMDDILGGTVRYYKDKATFTMPLKVTDTDLHVIGYFDYMACNEWQCIPFTADFKLHATIKP